MKQYNTEPVINALKTAKTVLILLASDPSLDVVAAGLSLYLSLTQRQLNASIGCSTPMTVNFNRLFGVNKIKSHIGNQNLVVSFNYSEDSLEKVSYDKDPAAQKFHLTIEPKAGKQPLDPGQVEFSYTGSNADLIFVLGARTLEDLGELYQQEKTLLDNKQKTLVNLSHLDKNSQFGTVNLYDPESSGCSEITLNLIKALGLPLEPDMATNLLAGIEVSTNNLQSPKITADTFETIAELMRLGAKKGHLASISRPTQFPQVKTLPRPVSPTLPQPIPQAQPAPPPLQMPTASPLMPQPIPASPQPDWLKPKVFKSSDTQV